MQLIARIESVSSAHSGQYIVMIISLYLYVFNLKLFSLQTPSHNSFKAAFKKLQQWIDNNKKDVLLVNSEILNVVHRCVTEKKFWPRDELHYLIKSGTLSERYQIQFYNACIFVCSTVL